MFLQIIGRNTSCFVATGVTRHKMGAFSVFHRRGSSIFRRKELFLKNLKIHLVKVKYHNADLSLLMRVDCIISSYMWYACRNFPISPARDLHKLLNLPTEAGAAPFEAHTGRCANIYTRPPAITHVSPHPTGSYPVVLSLNTWYPHLRRGSLTLPFRFFYCSVTFFYSCI